ncbi:MAG: hypothetical protein U9N77_13915, partial [Thermodesulfobacteriota bacterium]|nr:hypothetical protein [Thermodesulfobacteriota bacterium]
LKLKLKIKIYFEWGIYKSEGFPKALIGWLDHDGSTFPSHAGIDVTIFNFTLTPFTYILVAP